MNVLGISAFYHDAAACLLRDGEENILLGRILSLASTPVAAD